MSTVTSSTATMTLTLLTWVFFLPNSSSGTKDQKSAKCVNSRISTSSHVVSKPQSRHAPRQQYGCQPYAETYLQNACCREHINTQHQRFTALSSNHFSLPLRVLYIHYPSRTLYCFPQQFHLFPALYVVLQ